MGSTVREHDVRSARTGAGARVRFGAAARPHEWVALAAVLVCVALWLATGVPLLPVRPWLFEHALELTEFLLPALMVLLIVRLARRARRRGRADARLTRVTFAQHFGPRLIARYARYILSVQLVMTAYTSIKQAIPLINPGRYDGMLIDIERICHLGWLPPWALASSGAPQWWLTMLDRCYYLWFPIKPLIVGYFLTHRNVAKRHHFLAAYLGVWIVGALLGLMVPSHGPCYIDAGRFPAGEMPLCEFAEDWLGVHYEHLRTITLHGNGNLTFGTGLMAMPSLHVTICILYVVFLWDEARWARWGAVLFAVMIFLGSLYSGWHYAIDGYAGVFIVAFVVWATGKLPLPPRSHHGGARWWRSPAKRSPLRRGEARGYA